jgi:hypothetical protein
MRACDREGEKGKKVSDTGEVKEKSQPVPLSKHSLMTAAETPNGWGWSLLKLLKWYPTEQIGQGNNRPSLSQ